MIKIVKENIIKTHRYDEEGNDSLLTEVIEQYHYDSEEEKNEHRKQMETDGFSDSGQVRENIGTISKPKYVWFGSYYKYESR